MNKRILFVDDDPLLLELAALLAEPEVEHWKCVRAENHTHALGMLAAKKIDAIVVDFRRSAVEGPQLLNQVRRLYPQIIRISIFERDERETHHGCQQDANQFLTFATTEELFASLLRIGRLEAVLSQEQLNLLANRSAAGSPSSLVPLQILRELNTEKPSFQAIAAVARQCPALSAKLLETANSVAFGRKIKAHDLVEAVQYIGFSLIRSIVMSLQIFHDFAHIDLKKFSAKQLWNQARPCAQITHTVIRLEKPDANAVLEGDTADLLNHLGKVMLAKNKPSRETNSALTSGHAQNHILPETEPIPDIFRTEGSATLFGLWGVSTPVIEAVAFQLLPVENRVRLARPPAIDNSIAIQPCASAFDPKTSFGLNFAPHFEFSPHIIANDPLAFPHHDVCKLFTHDA
jgi:HD-like signal output (HDOD) protein